MPELPEVETVRRSIEAGWAPGVTLLGVRFSRKNLRFSLPSKAKCRLIEGRALRKVCRRGKYLIYYFDGGGCAVSHLGMSGSWRWSQSRELGRSHDHILMTLSHDLELIYNDPRRFGSFEILKESELPLQKALAKMGPDPLLDELHPQDFLFRAERTGASIKSLLLNQSFIAGVGNIYACEALFLAGIHPEKSGRTLSLVQWSDLLKTIPKLFKQAISSGGSTIRDFGHASGKKGNFQKKLNVYGRAMEPCRRCGSPIFHKVIGQRSTFWCEVCQPSL